MFQLVSYEWERVDGALITAAMRMGRTLYKWSGARRLQVWNLNESRFDVVDEMMPVELLEWFRDLDEEGNSIALKTAICSLTKATLNVVSSSGG